MFHPHPARLAHLARLLVTLAMALGVLAGCTLAAPAPADAAAKCSRYKTWPAAINAHRAGVPGLDGDRDGYPCEQLVLKTPVKKGATIVNEPSCVRSWFTTNCSGRDLFRQVYWMTGTPAALYGAGVDVFVPILGRSKSTHADLAEFRSTARQPGTLTCSREFVLEFVAHQARAKDSLEAAVQLFDSGPGALKSLRSMTYGGPVSGLYEAYLAAGKKLAKAASKVRLSEQARTQLRGTMLCGVR